MIVDTVKGCSYVLTCAGACTVHAVLPTSELLLLVEAEAGGQFVFVAPTDAVEVSDEHALVTLVFKGAVMGSSAQGGGFKSGEDAVLKSLMVTGRATMDGGIATEINDVGDNYWQVVSNLDNAKVMELRSANNGAYIDVEVRDGGLWLSDQAGSCESVLLYDLYSETRLNSLTARKVFTAEGPAVFAAGVTMSQSLTVVGRSVFQGGAGVGETVTFYDKAGIHAATITGYYMSPFESGLMFGSSSGINFLKINYDAESKCVDVLHPIAGSSLSFPGVTSFGRIVKQAQSDALAPTDVPSCAEGDTRWARVRTDLTDAQYTDLTEKDATTFYITSDGGKIYLGSHAFN